MGSCSWESSLLGLLLGRQAQPGTRCILGNVVLTRLGFPPSRPWDCHLWTLGPVKGASRVAGRGRGGVCALYHCLKRWKRRLLGSPKSPPQHILLMTATARAIPQGQVMNDCDNKRELWLRPRPLRLTHQPLGCGKPNLHRSEWRGVSSWDLKLTPDITI